MTSTRCVGIGLFAALVVGLMIAALVWALNVRGESAPGPTGTATVPEDHQIARGAYLARAGNCRHCHTERGGAPFAGGRGIDTPFGTVYSSNLTPDGPTGLGRWSRAEFFRALHNGRSKDGRLLYPAFPYPNFTLLTREDSDALFAYLQSLPGVERPNKPHALRWPYDSQAALAIWRALYFKPGTFVPDRARSVEWNRGAYLGRGLGHCATCHGARDALGGIDDLLAQGGGAIPMQGWYAPSLGSPHEAGVADWPLSDIVQLLRSGVSPRGVTTGPMAEVVLHGTQYLSADDLTAVATWLKALAPTSAAAHPGPPAAAGSKVSTAERRGAKLYETHCATCHGDDGQGHGVGDANGFSAYPPLSDNRAVTMANTSNLVQVVLYGGFAPATVANPRPFGMPPFVLTLTNAEIAAVLTYLRSAWGNDAAEVTELDVNRVRSSQDR